MLTEHLGGLYSRLWKLYFLFACIPSRSLFELNHQSVKYSLMTTCADGRSVPLSLIYPVVWSVLSLLTVPVLRDFYSLSVGWFFFFIIVIFVC